MKRILALLLTVIMLFGTLAIDLGAVAVDPPIYILDDNKKPTKEIDYEATLKEYLTLEFATEQEKLETMEMMYEKDGYQLWVDTYTGEVATVCLASGQILFSNPYDIGVCGSSEAVKKELYSQILVKYTDNDTEKTMNSFTEAASRGQIDFEYIKNGIRVEYSMGREETRMLVPRVIERTRFEENILQPFADEINKISTENGYIVLDWRNYLSTAVRNNMIKDSSPTGEAKDGNTEWFKFLKFLAFYQEKFLGECETAEEERSMKALFPICTKMDIWVCTPDITQNELITVEGYIKTYVPSYTFEQLEQDHLLTEYEGADKSPPLFKMALEYTLDEWGMSVRLPANGLRFDESLYQLTYVSILPYMGAGANYLTDQKEETFTGYNFFPDGAGTLFRHEDLVGKGITTVNGKVYGQDFAYNTITGSNQQTIRYPVFGIVSNTHNTLKEKQMVPVTEESVDADGNVIILDKDGNVVPEHIYEEAVVDKYVEEDKGFVAIIEEGDALAELSDYHMGTTGKYNTVQMLFYPRPKDSYNLANAISVGANATWTVVSSRKYVGNYKIRYIMLTDDEIAEEKEIDKYYECSWMGMASAYRDYLYAKGELEALTESDVQEDIPMYIETFGTLETLEKILSVPVNVMTPLTSFESVKTMYDELSEQGVSNIKFKLTGYANGGMYSSVPYKLQWEKAVGGDDGFADLLDYSAEKGFEVFPEFDFAYVRSSTNTLFDGLTLKNHIVKSINDTYMSRRYYSATRQTHVGRFELAISAAYFSHFYDKLTENLLGYYENTEALSAISVSTLGNSLNSDFDEDEPYNREDSKRFTKEIFSKMSEDYDLVMTEGANAYTWKYVDYIINVPLDSSRYNKSSNAVPFIGVVLHGSVEFAGTPLNMEGNIGYSMLKAIENGSGIYFVLCYENYEELKEDQRLSEYYSVRYDILKGDVVKYYQVLNDLTKDLQLHKIVNHKFLIGERVPDEDEAIADEEQLKKEEEIANKLEEEAAALLLQSQLLEGRVYAATNSQSALEAIITGASEIHGYYNGAVTVNENGIVNVRIGMDTLVKAALEKGDAKNELDELNTLATLWGNIFDKYYSKKGNFVGQNLSRFNLEKAYRDAVKSLDTAKNSLPEKEEALAAAIVAAAQAKVENIASLIDKYDEAEKILAETPTDAADYTRKKNNVETALKAITNYFTLDEARAYVATLATKAAAIEAIDAYTKGLEDAAVVAEKAYQDAKAAIAKTLADDADYAAKVEAYELAKKEHTAIESAIKTLYVKLGEIERDYPGCQEIGFINDKIAEYEAKAPAAKAALDAALDAVDAIIASKDASFAALKADAEAKRDAADNYEDDAEYLTQNAIVVAQDAIIEATVADFTARATAAYQKIADEFLALLATQEKVKNEFAELEKTAYEGAEYSALLKKQEEAEAAVQAVLEGYTEDKLYIVYKQYADAIDAKITELTAKLNAANADRKAIAEEIIKLTDIKYKTVTPMPKVVELPEDVEDNGQIILSVEPERTDDGFVIGAGYVLDKLITEFQNKAKNTAAYKTANDALTAAKTTANTFKNNKVNALKLTAEYKNKDEQERKPANSAVSNYVIDNNDLKTAITQLNSTKNSIPTAQATYDAAKAALDAAAAYTGMDGYVAIAKTNDDILAVNPNILAEYALVAKDYNTAFGRVRSQITSINSNIKSMNTQLDRANTNLQSSLIATEYYGAAEAGKYSAEFLTALEKVFNATRENTKEANSIADTAILEAKKALEIATQIIPSTVTDIEFTALRMEIAADGTVTIPEEKPEEEEETPEEEEEEEYEYTKYTDDSGNIVYVEYENGVFFILNYNYFDVTVVFNETTYTLSNYGGVRVNPDGTTVSFKTTNVNVGGAE